MNNLYRKIAVASVCTALSFTLGANKEAKAATFALTATRFVIEGNSYSGVGERVLDSEDPSAALISVEKIGDFNGTTSLIERRAFYEFNFGNLSLAPDTVIRSAILNVAVETTTVKRIYKYLYVNIFGYVGNGKPDLSDFGAGVSLDTDDVANPLLWPGQFYTIKSDVTQFVNARVSNRDTFAGFGIRIEDYFANYGRSNMDYSPYLIIESEPVPEPTTIFGSAIGLCLGGWLKRKKSSQQHKTVPQR